MNIGPLVSAPAAGGIAVSPGSGAGGFARLLTRFLSDAGAQQVKAEQSVLSLAAGKADSVHNVMLSMAKADLSFHLALEIRNRLSDAYQEIMRMQV